MKFSDKNYEMNYIGEQRKKYKKTDISFHGGLFIFFLAH